MSTIDLAVQRVSRLDERLAAKLLVWLDRQQQARSSATEPLGAHAMIGFAHRAGRPPRTTASWMAELREGEEA